MERHPKLTPSIIPTRRDFLKQAGKGLCLTTLYPLFAANSLSAAPLATEEVRPDTGTGKSLGIALVGLGSYAMGQLAPVLQHHTQNCHLAALVTGTPEKAVKYGKQYSIPETHIYDYANFDTIADNPDVDVVYVVLPNSMHAEFTIRAAAAGKHVICEKPMALSAAEAQSMIDACKQHGVHLYVGYRLHYDPYHQAIIQCAREKPFGPARYVRPEFSFFMGNPKQWRLRKALAGGGAVMDLGVYCIQAARYATGLEPIAITAQEFKTDKVKFAEVDETVTFQLEFPDGAIANCTTSYSHSTNQLFISYRDNWAKAEINDAYGYDGQNGHVNNKALHFEVESQQALQIDAQCQHMLQGGPCSTTGAEGLADMKVVDALYRSLQQGGRVMI